MAVVASGVFMATLDASIVNVSLPTLANELNASFDSVQWVSLAYLLIITGLLLPAGRLAQMHGAKPVFLTGFVIFTLGSLLAGLATSVWILVAFRVIQGIGGSITQALGPGMVVSTFPQNERGKAIGMILAAVSLGLVSGPLVGGIFLSTLGWPFIFLINVPFGLAAIGLGFRVLPPSQRTSPGKFDWPGTTLLLAGIFLILLGFNRIQIFGLGSPLVLTLIVAGFALLFCFAWWQTRTASPMIQPSIFRNPDFTVAVFSGYLTFAGTSAHVLLLPFYLQRVLQLPISQVGLIMATVPAIMGILGTPAGILADRTSHRAISSIGIVISAVGLVLLATVTFNTPPLALVVRLVVLGVGFALFNSGNASMLMGAAKASHQNQASAMLALARNMATSTGQALWGTIWALVLVLQLGEGAPDKASGPEMVDAFRIVFGSASLLLIAGVLVPVLAPMVHRQRLDPL